jgi:hypothetical protein
VEWEFASKEAAFTPDSDRRRMMQLIGEPQFNSTPIDTSLLSADRSAVHALLQASMIRHAPENGTAAAIEDIPGTSGINTSGELESKQ